jgi:ketosteroid isomerase-like protein
MAASKDPVSGGRRDNTAVDVADYAKETDFADGSELTDIDKQPGPEPIAAGADDIKATVVALYEAFSRGDRPTFEALMTDDFRFTSPYDDALDRAEFFERCWPNHLQQTQLTLQRISVDGGGAFVTYTVQFRDGHEAENTEWLAFRDGKLQSVDVYFGASHAPSSSRAEHDRDKPYTNTTRALYGKRQPRADPETLAPILGTWKVTGRNAPRAGSATQPDDPSLGVEGEETYEMMRGDFFVMGRWTHRFPDGGEHTGVSVLGNEPERGSIMCENFDNLGYAREYRVSIDGQTWKLTGAHERATYTFAGGGTSFTVEWESSTDGREWTPLCRLEAHRSPPP